MKGIIATREELNMVLANKPLHQALLAVEFSPVNHAHVGRTLYVTYAEHSKTDDPVYQIVQWQWDNNEGWKPFLYADKVY